MTTTIRPLTLEDLPAAWELGRLASGARAEPTALDLLGSGPQARLPDYF